MKPARFWAIVFAAMEKSLALRDTEPDQAVFLAEAVGKLLAARQAHQRARFEYLSLRAFLAGQVGEKEGGR